jgi:hypothetical protein
MTGQLEQRFKKKRGYKKNIARQYGDRLINLCQLVDGRWKAFSGDLIAWGITADVAESNIKALIDEGL